MKRLPHDVIRNSVIGIALMTEQGERRLAHAKDYLARQLTARRFNTERAIEVFTYAIDNAVWSDTKGQKDGRGIYADYKQSGLGPEVARRMTEDFIAATGATDQRP